MSNGKFVYCTSGKEDSQEGQWVSRVVCLVESRPGCSSCPHSRFNVNFQLRVADQIVACPQWSREEDRREKRDPDHYIEMRRERCIGERPFPHCHECPNAKPKELPRTRPKWYEEAERRRRIELELDEEERDE